MRTEDMAIKYKALYQTAELMIANIKEIGFDVSKYEEILKSISENVKTEVKASYNKGYARANYEINYTSGMPKLNFLINQLEKYDVYYKVLNSCEWLNIKITEKNITREKLREYVSEMTYNLKQIVTSDTMDYDNEKHIVEMVYEVAYKIIKLELMMTGTSNLYNYVKQEDINISYFNVIVKKELTNIKDKNNLFIKQKLFEIRKSGINSNYFDLDLIKALLIYDGNNSFKDNINKSVSTIIEKINDNNNEIKKLLNQSNNNKYDRDEYRRSTNENRKNFISRFISLIIASSIMIGGGTWLLKESKKESIKDKYIKTTEIYSTITDETTTETNEVLLHYEPTNDTIVMVYNPYENESKRGYQYYDVSYLDFDSPKEFYEYGIDNYVVVAKDGTLRTKDNDTISDYQDSYTEVIKSTYEYIDTELDNTEYIQNLKLALIIYLICGFIFEGLYSGITEGKYPSIIIGGIRELYEEAKELLSNKKRYKEYDDKIANIVNQILGLISQNDELRNEFNRLYETNKYLLDNPDELYQRFSRLNDNEDTKKLVKEKKSENNGNKR